MAEPLPEKNAIEMKPRLERFNRFDIIQRIEHLVFFLSFAMLGLTGLAQKFAVSPVAEFIIRVLGGIERIRIIHRTSSVVMMVVVIFHIIDVLYRIIVRRVSLDIIPSLEDFRHLFRDVLFYLGFRKKKASYGRYNYAEKVEYFAVVWGTLIMGITGFMMWNPISTVRFLPGQFVPAARAAHGGEAILAVLALILWHFYHVHFRHLNKSMFLGWLSREEMEEEHPAELAYIDSGRLPPLPSREVIRRRERVFIPTAIVLSLVLGFGVFKFITLEETAITTIPPGESALVFVPQTPTPEPTLTPTLTPSEILATSWEGGFEILFQDRCGTCHVLVETGGLSLATYEGALKGGEGGPAIVPGSPENSILLRVQAAGNHPGQLTEDELTQVTSWIEAGAPEK